MQYIHVKVKTEMKKESLKQKEVDHFEISVKEKAENNMANKKLLELIAQHFKVPLRKVHIINGHHHPSKLLTVNKN